MLRAGLIHPQILEVLGSAGHGSMILISDGNYPSLTAPYAGARKVYLNLRPGLISVTDILATLLPMIPIERVAVMEADDGSHPAVQDEILGMVGSGTEAVPIERHEFYAATRSEDLALVIVSGDRRWYANVLLTIGSTPEN